MRDFSRLQNLVAVRHKQAVKAQSWYRIRNAGSAQADVYIYDLIGDDGWGGGISARDFAQDIQAVTAPEMVVHISSEGGSVFEGLAIYESIKQHPARVISSIDSLAASAASFIAMAGDHIRMARNARMMMHDAAVGYVAAAGNARDLRDFIVDVEEMAVLLDDISDNIADIYAQRAGGTVEEWRARMSKETWFSAAQALEAGLVDEIPGEGTAAPAESTTSEPGDALDLDAEAFAAMIREAWA